MIIPYPTLHTSVALGGVASPRGGETRKRLDEPTPDQVRGDERRAAPAPALRRWEIPAFAGMTSWGRGTPKMLELQKRYPINRNAVCFSVRHIVLCVGENASANAA